MCSGSKLFRDELDPHERAKYRTECWLERCIFEERICSPDEHVSFAPIPVPTPVDGACFHMPAFTTTLLTTRRDRAYKLEFLGFG